MENYWLQFVIELLLCGWAKRGLIAELMLYLICCTLQHTLPCLLKNICFDIVSSASFASIVKLRNVELRKLICSLNGHTYCTYMALHKFSFSISERVHVKVPIMIHD